MLALSRPPLESAARLTQVTVSSSSGGAVPVVVGDPAPSAGSPLSLQRLPLLILQNPPRIPRLFAEFFTLSSKAMPTDVWSWLAVAGLLFVSGLYIIHMIAFVYSKYRLHRPVRPDRSLPGVSVIKPLVGVEENLRENLETFFTSVYHQYELLFCVHSPEDDCVPVLKEIMKKYPAVDARIFYKGEKVGLNPKINNMMPAYRAAKHPLVLVSDSGISMRPDAIQDMVATIESDPKTALVTQMPYCKDRPGLSAALEQVYFGTSHGRIYLAGNCLNFVCSTGMSSLMRKSALDECGGIQAFGGYLAEDYFFGVELAKRGYKSAISTHPALQNSSSVSIASFLDRICRWIKLRIAMLPHIIVLEPLQDCFPSGLIASFSATCLFGFNPLTYFLIHTALWLTMDYSLMLSIQNGPMPFPTRYFLLAWLIRELSAPLVFATALFRPAIRWRNNSFRLAWGGKIKSC
ncbi:unnamed protein product [Caenorhabditis auriculariae]|uniref:ceramide glucosyltransferase n=1 Tax=Caenorhabditis auriculariae TaxID=2777116 RepID=A0A8S1HQC7_9PELO|nr:unnamed protein product [Caenorhabditis auriculariae]